MKKLILSLPLLATVFVGSACTQDPPPEHHVAHHVHHTSRSTVSATTDAPADNFHAVTKPDTYSGQ